MLFSLLVLFSCTSDPVVRFHSFEELTHYPYMMNYWTPSVVNQDLLDLRYAYNVTTENCFGKFSFSKAESYDSVFATLPRSTVDSFMIKMKTIRRPGCPEWFIAMDEIQKGNYEVRMDGSYSLLLKSGTKEVYFLK